MTEFVKEIKLLDHYLPGRVGSPLSGIGRASTGSTATKIIRKIRNKQNANCKEKVSEIITLRFKTLNVLLLYQKSFIWSIPNYFYFLVSVSVSVLPWFSVLGWLKLSGWMKPSPSRPGSIGAEL